MIRAMQGWMAFPFRLAIAVGVAWMLSSSFESPTSKLDMTFLSQPEVLSAPQPKPDKLEAVASGQQINLAGKVGISATVALVLYVWIANEWIGYKRSTRSYKRSEETAPCRSMGSRQGAR